MAVGCAQPSIPATSGAQSWEAFLADGADRGVEADWNDVKAAVGVGASRSEMAIVASDDGSDPSRRVFELKTVRDEPAWLLITRGSPMDADDRHEAMMSAMSMQRGEMPQTLVMRAKVGRFGDREREQQLLRAVAERLQELKGRDWHPVD